MARRSATVHLTEREKHLLEKAANRKKIPSHFKHRIGVLLYAYSGYTNQAMAKQLGCGEQFPGLWRHRWHDNYERLQAFSQGIDGEGVSDSELVAEMLKILSDAPRSGAPKRITESERELLVALALEKPEQHGIAVEQWTHKLLAQKAKEKGIVTSISPSHYGHILRKKNGTSQK